MKELIRISSSRTEIMKMALIFSGVALGYTAYNLLTISKNDNEFILALFYSAVAVVFVYSGVKLSVLMHFQGDFKILNFTGRHVELKIDEFEIDKTNQFQLDPLGITKFTIIKYSKNEKQISSLVMNKTKLSEYSNLKKLLQTIKSRRGNKSM